MNTLPHNRCDDTEVLVGRAAQSLFSGTAPAGPDFFISLVSTVADTLNVHGAWVAEYDARGGRMRALAFRLGGTWLDGFEYPIAGTPCERVVTLGELVHYPERVREFFPADGEFFDRSGAVAYLGEPLVDGDGEMFGLLAVIDNRPMVRDPRRETLFRIFAARATAEMLRLRAESRLRQREQRWRGLMHGVMDAVIELDAGLYVTDINPAACAMFRCEHAQVAGRSVARLLSPGAAEKLSSCVAGLSGDAAGAQCLSIADGVTAVRSDGTAVDAEARLIGGEYRGDRQYLLVLRECHAPEYAVAEAPAGRDAVRGTARIYTDQEVQQFERDNIVRALEATGWRVSGDDGAAHLLGVNASTLSSRIKALGIQRPA